MTEEKHTIVTSQKPVVFYDIFIAGPGDVHKERFYIRDKILLWTRDNAEATGIHLRPRMWELDSPGGTWLKDAKRPEKNSSQWIIDEKVVKRCSFLIAVFADRLGTPPDKKYPSGTAREIDIHASTGKPSKIFFCSSPYGGVDVEGLNERQRLDEYRQKIERQEFSWIAAYHLYPRKKFNSRFNRQFDLLIQEIKAQALQDFDSLVSATLPLSSIPPITETISTLLDFTPAELKIFMLIYRTNETVFFVHKRGANTTENWELATDTQKLLTGRGAGNVVKAALCRLVDTKRFLKRTKCRTTIPDNQVFVSKTLYSPQNEGRIFLQNLKKITPNSLTATISPLPNQFVWSSEHGIGVVETVEDNEAQITVFPDMEEKIIPVTLDKPDSPLYKFY